MAEVVVLVTSWWSWVSEIVGLSGSGVVVGTTGERGVVGGGGGGWACPMPMPALWGAPGGARRYLPRRCCPMPVAADTVGAGEGPLMRARTVGPAWVVRGGGA